MSCRLWLLILLLPLALAGCPGDIKPTPPAPTVVVKEVDKYVTLDRSLLKDCPIAEPASLKVKEAVKVANARKLSLQKCNADKAAIRAAQPASPSSTGNTP